MNIQVSREVAGHVLWHFRREGFQPGSFIEALLVAFSRADRQNWTKLSAGFPDYALAMNEVVNAPDGLDQLRKIFQEGHSDTH